METEPEMVQTLEFIDKDFIGATRSQLKNVKENISIMNEKIGSPCRGIYRVGTKVGLQLLLHGTEFILVLLLINYCVIFHMNTVNLLFAPRCK